jgi:hypothetical protein
MLRDNHDWNVANAMNGYPTLSRSYPKNGMYVIRQSFQHVHHSYHDATGTSTVPSRKQCRRGMESTYASRPVRILLYAGMIWMLQR